MPPGLKLALGPILPQIAEMTLENKQYDRDIQRLTQTDYAETQAMMTIHGIGHVTALTFVLTSGIRVDSDAVETSVAILGSD